VVTTTGATATTLFRLVRAKAATDPGHTIHAGETPVTLELPPSARFAWPTGASESSE